MEDVKRYAVVRDYQGGDFGMYRLYTIDEWRKQALEWATSDDMDGVITELENLKDENVIDYISEYWDLRFKEIVINNWCWDNHTNELVLYNRDFNTFKELFVIKNFTQADYNQLPQDDYECLNKIIERLNNDWWYGEYYDEKVKTTIFDNICD